MMRVLIKMQRTKYEPEEEYTIPNSKWMELKRSNDVLRSELGRLKHEFNSTRQQTKWD